MSLLLTNAFRDHLRSAAAADAGLVNALRGRCPRLFVRPGGQECSHLPLLIDHGLLDELHIWLHPLLVGTPTRATTSAPTPTTDRK
jgi:hypothetical protein